MATTTSEASAVRNALNVVKSRVINVRNVYHNHHIQSAAMETELDFLESAIRSLEARVRELQ